MTSALDRPSEEESGLVAQLSLEQKVRLLTGADAWTLHGVEEIGLRPVVMSDGPAGVRGTRYDRQSPSSSLPCPVALGATWDEELMARLSRALGEETRAKGVDVLLAPTMNIIRTPLAGRGFECYSEDPLLTTRLAVAYVRGIQAGGVGATAKHFVANDSETERRTYDARIAEHVLRELYLPPFEACVNEAEVALVMAAYNSVNGATMTANATLLTALLKTEWEFPGVVVSDWNAAQTTVASAIAGLDLVMPGPRGPWGEQLLAAVRAGAVPEAVIDDKVGRLLGLARRVGALNGSSPEHVNGGAPLARMIPAELLREAAARSFVLLANPRRLLPLDAATVRRLARAGPNAVAPTTQGGGSVRVLAVDRPSLADALRGALGEGGAVPVHQGCVTGPNIALPRDESLRDPLTGESGVRLEVWTAEGENAYDEHHSTSVASWWDGLPAAVHVDGSEVVMRGRYRAPQAGRYWLGAAGIGILSVSVEGQVLAEARTVHPRDVVEAFSRPPELRIPVDLVDGQEVDVAFTCRPDVKGTHTGFVTMRLGIARHVDDEALIAEAAAAAKESDVAVVVVGSPEGSESEGFDRQTLALAGRQDDLVRQVAAANPRTIVVVNSGMPVLMPWADDVAAVVQAWLPGQAFGEALADCLFGVAEPGGRLPVSMPRAEADAPVLHAHPEGGELPYGEGLLVGYRGYDRSGVAPRFGFGHGLGYTEWTYESIAVGSESIHAGEDLALTVTVRNAGSRPGREVVQVYLEAPDDDPARPVRILAAFKPVDARAGEEVGVALTVPARAFARYDDAGARWTWRPGRYALRAGASSRDLKLAAPVELR